MQATGPLQISHPHITNSGLSLGVPSPDSEAAAYARERWQTSSDPAPLPERLPARGPLAPTQPSAVPSTLPGAHHPGEWPSPLPSTGHSLWP